MTDGSAASGQGPAGTLLADLKRQWWRAYGLARSLRLYWANPLQLRRMRRFYAGFVAPGQLCFDIGAHAGNRAWTFAKLGARVVAVEPQPLFHRLLSLLFRGQPAVTLLPVAVGAQPGSVELVIASATPTVTTASSGFRAAVATVPSFAWVEWDERLSVPMLTLDQLIERHGLPDFVKIDVEGMEAEVLAGLTRRVAAISFEFVPAHDDAARACIERLTALGDYEFNVSLGESMVMELDRWCRPRAMLAWLEQRDPAGPSGDIYARLVA
jgi:FkbM family methyltransferase